MQSSYDQMLTNAGTRIGGDLQAAADKAINAFGNNSIFPVREPVVSGRSEVIDQLGHEIRIDAFK